MAELELAMDIRVLTCGYSYHSQRFQTGAAGALNSYLFRLQTEGYARALIQDSMVVIQPGDLLLYKPGLAYKLVVEEHDNERLGPTITSGDYYMFCQGSWLDEWWRRADRPVKSRIDPDDKLLSLWRMIIAEKHKFQESGIELCGYLLQALCLKFDQAIADAPSVTGKNFTASRMKSYIEENASTPLKIEDVARHVNLSVSRAVHLFKECYGKSMIQYTLEVRLSIAIERMAYTTMTLEQIADACGFGSYSYFHRVFRDRHGVSPTEYRDQLREGE